MIAAKGVDGKLLIEITNVDPENSAIIDAHLAGIAAKLATAETLTAPAVNSINTFDVTKTVVPKPAAVKVQSGEISLTVPPRSVTLISVEE